MDIIGSQSGNEVSLSGSAQSGIRGNCVASEYFVSLIKNYLLQYRLHRQQTLLDAHYIIADHPNYVQLMKTYVKSKCKLSDNYCIHVFKDPPLAESLLENEVPLKEVPLNQIYLIVVYYSNEMYIYEIPYTELSEHKEHKLSIYDEWITKYRVLLVMY